MNTIIINGVRYEVEGDSVSVDETGTVRVNGKTVSGPQAVNLKVQWEGQLASLVSHRSVEVHGDVTGGVIADGSVKCQNVQGNVAAEGSVSCGNVGGSVKADGSVNCGSVTGNVRAGGSVCHR